MAEQLDYFEHQTFHINRNDEQIVSFFKAFYEAHRELQPEIPHRQTEPEILEAIGNFLTQNTHYAFQDRFTADDIIDRWHLSIEAMIHPNYLPASIHTHSFYEIIYILKGNCINYSGNKSLALSAGDVLIIAPGTEHAISLFNDESVVVNIIVKSDIFDHAFYSLFSGKDIFTTFFSDILHKRTTNSFILFHSGTDSTIRSCVLNLLSLAGMYHYRQDELKLAYIQLFFSQILAKYESDAEVYRDDSRPFNKDVTLMLHYMQEHYADISLKQMAEFFGYSERHISRMIAEATGKNFQENLSHIRMENACLLLIETDEPMEQISGECGYTSSRNFRYSFQKTQGCSPREYRNRHSGR